MADDHHNGRAPKAEKRKLVSLYLSDSELATIDAARGTLDRSAFVRDLVLRSLAHNNQELRPVPERSQ